MLGYQVGPAKATGNPWVAGGRDLAQGWSEVVRRCQGSVKNPERWMVAISKATLAPRLGFQEHQAFASPPPRPDMKTRLQICGDTEIESNTSCSSKWVILRFNLELLYFSSKAYIAKTELGDVAKWQWICAALAFFLWSSKHFIIKCFRIKPVRREICSHFLPKQLGTEIWRAELCLRSNVN